MRAAGGGTPDTQFLMRAHRRLLSLAQGQREPLLLNETQSPINPDGFPYRVLCCSLRSRTGRFIGVLALLRDAGAEAFNERDAHIAEILARKAIGVIESSYDALSGLYTRAALERRVRALVAELKPHAGLERALHRRRPAARHQREVRHARGRRPARRSSAS